MTESKDSSTKLWARDSLSRIKPHTNSTFDSLHAAYRRFRHDATTTHLQLKIDNPQHRHALYVWIARDGYSVWVKYMQCDPDIDFYAAFEFRCRDCGSWSALHETVFDYGPDNCDSIIARCPFCNERCCLNLGPFRHNSSLETPGIRFRWKSTNIISIRKPTCEEAFTDRRTWKRIHLHH